MTKRPIPFPADAARKRRRTVAELEHTAQAFARDWYPGDRVMTWLHRHEGRTHELSRLVADGWVWDDVGRAMHLAGIAYRTGTPIKGGVLRRKASQARLHAARPAVRPASDLPITSPEPAARNTPRSDPPPEFRLITPRVGAHPLLAPTRPEQHPHESLIPDDVTDEALVARALGIKHTTTP